MPTWHSTLHAFGLPAGLLSLASVIWIAAQMVAFVTRYRMQAAAVGGERWPRLWWWVAGSYLLFGALLVLYPASYYWPGLCVYGTTVCLVSAPVLVTTGILFHLGIRDGKGFYRSPSRRGHLEQMVMAAAQRVLHQAEAERNGPG